MRKKPFQVKIQKLPPPHPIIQHYPNLQLYVDYFFVNRLPFLHTKSSKIDFLTVQSGDNRNTNSIIQGLQKVVNTYTKRGFTITDLHGDNEFDIQEIKDELEPINTHIYGKVEHVGTIERSVRTVKQRCRALCHALPYRRYTKLMVYSLVENAIYWLNTFPTSTGVIQQLSPASIVLGKSRPDFSKPHIAFGSYAMVYNSTNNNMSPRTIPAIALKPSNQHGGSYFMSLLSGKRIHSYHWKELPIPDEVIERVHFMAKEEKQPLLHDGAPIFEWSIGAPVQDLVEMDNEANDEQQEIINLEHYTHEDVRATTSRDNEVDDVLEMSTDNVPLDNEAIFENDNDNIPNSTLFEVLH